MKWLCLLGGGVAGTLLRYGFSRFVWRFAGTEFPYGTLAVNVTGCLIAGFLTEVSREKFMLTPEAQLFLFTGFCGAYTTFSTFIFETSDLMKNGQAGAAVLNVALSILLGLFAFQFGIVFAKQL